MAANCAHPPSGRCFAVRSAAAFEISVSVARANLNPMSLDARSSVPSALALSSQRFAFSRQAEYCCEDLTEQYSSSALRTSAVVVTRLDWMGSRIRVNSQYPLGNCCLSRISILFCISAHEGVPTANNPGYMYPRIIGNSLMLTPDTAQVAVASASACRTIT